jgi:hypothetical protein
VPPENAGIAPNHQSINHAMRCNTDTESVAEGPKKTIRNISAYTWAGEIRNAYSILIGKSVRKNSLGGPRDR